MRIKNYDSQSALHRQGIYSPQWIILRVMMHVMYNIAFTAISMASKMSTFLKANCLNY